MFLSRNKKNNVYPCNPQFYYIKVGFKGVKIIYACFCDGKALRNKAPYSHVLNSTTWDLTLGPCHYENKPIQIC